MSFRFILYSDECPYFYHEGHYCSHRSVQGVCKQEVCVFVKNGCEVVEDKEGV